MNKTHLLPALLVLISCMTFGPSPVFSQWVSRQTGTNANFYGVSASLNGRVWAVGDKVGAVLSEDGGMTWRSRDLGSAILKAVVFDYGSHGIVVGTSGTTLRTTNNGEDWLAISSGTSAHLQAATLLKNGTAVAVGAGGTILTSTDTGATWTSAQSNTTATLWGVASAGRFVYAVGAAGTVLRSSDDGNTWSVIRSGLSWDYYSVACIDSSDVIVVGQSEIARWSETTSTWTRLRWNGMESHYSTCFITPSTGYVSGSKGEILKTTNAGVTWVPQATGITGGIRSIYFASESVGWAAGDAGAILSTTNGGATWMDGPQVAADGPAVFEVYPNPSSASVCISSRTAGLKLDEIELTDFAGKSIYVNRQGTQSQDGLWSVDVSNLTPGLYYIRVTTSAPASAMYVKAVVVR